MVAGRERRHNQLVININSGETVTTETAKKPSVLFVCVHNAGRSQMAAAFLTTLSKGEIEVRSAGSQPAD